MILKEDFLEKIIRLSTMSFNNELADLRQRENEALTFYYRRMTFMMQRVEAKD